MNRQEFLPGYYNFYFKCEEYPLFFAVNSLPNQLKSILLLNDVNLMQTSGNSRNM